MPDTPKDVTSEMEAFFKQRGFGLRIGFGQRPALVVVDMLIAFTDTSMPLGCDQDDNLLQIRRLLDVAREVAIPIYFTVQGYEEENLRDAGVWALKQKGVQTLIAGTRAVEIHPSLERRRTEPTILKNYASAFFGTDFDTRLTFRGIDTLVITGCSTSGCVRATAVDALQNGYRPMVVRECVADRAKLAHEQSLFDLEAKYADVVGIEETQEYLRGLRAAR